MLAYVVFCLWFAATGWSRGLTDTAVWLCVEFVVCVVHGTEATHRLMYPHGGAYIRHGTDWTRYNLNHPPDYLPFCGS